MIREEGNRSAGGRSQPAQGRPDPFHDLRVQRRPSGRAPPHRHSELRSMGSGHTSRERVRPGGTGIVRLHVADLRRSTGHRSGSLSSPVVPEASCWQRPSVVLVQQSSPHTRHPRLRHGPARSAWLSSPPRRGRIIAGATHCAIARHSSVITGGILLADPGHPVAFRAVRHSAFGGEALDKEQTGRVSRRVLQDRSSGR